MKIKTSYEGMTATKQYLSVHFRLEVGGSLVRHSMVKVAISEIDPEVLARVLDTHTRRLLLITWAADQELLPWDDEE